MFTVYDARKIHEVDLDGRIEAAVRESEGSGAYIRIYHDDPFRHSIKEELQRRGFTNVRVPDIFIKGDVWFEW